jgi:hypothetical protein
MIDYIRGLLNKYKQKGILIDTNTLLILSGYLKKIGIDSINFDSIRIYGYK